MRTGTKHRQIVNDTSPRAEGEDRRTGIARPAAGRAGRPGRFLPILALVFAGCGGQESVSLLERQGALARLDASRAELRHLEQEQLREQAHVDELTRRVETLRAREAVLDQEAADLSARVAAAEDRLRALKEKAAAIDAETKTETARIDAAQQAKNRIPELEAKLKELTAEVEKIGAELEAAKKQAEPPAPAPAPAPAPPGGGN